MFVELEFCSDCRRPIDRWLAELILVLVLTDSEDLSLERIKSIIISLCAQTTTARS